MYAKKDEVVPKWDQKAVVHLLMEPSPYLDYTEIS